MKKIFKLAIFGVQVDAFLIEFLPRRQKNTRLRQGYGGQVASRFWLD